MFEIGVADSLYGEAAEIRYRALYEGLGLPRTLIEDTDGRTYVHFVAIAQDGRVIGYARLHLAGGESQAYQIVVGETDRRRGVGTALVRAIEARASAEGRDFLELDARDHAVGFYERLGFVVTGEPFLSLRTGTPHRHMWKGLL